MDYGMNFNKEQEYKHANKERLCYHCNELIGDDNNVIKHQVSGRGYMSDFDDMDFTIQLCEHCNSELGVQDEWFDNEKSFNVATGSYNDETYIWNLVELFPIPNQEYIHNCVTSLMEQAGVSKMSREDWILSHQ